MKTIITISLVLLSVLCKAQMISTYPVTWVEIGPEIKASSFVPLNLAAVESIRTKTDAEYIDMALAADLDLNPRMVEDFADSSFQYFIVISSFDTLGFTFPEREVPTKKFYLITSQVDRDSVDNNALLYEITNKVRQGLIFWNNN